MNTDSLAPAPALAWLVWLLVVLLLIAAGLAASAVVREWKAVLAQLQALAQGRLVESRVSRVPGIGRMTRQINATVQRLRGVYVAQAEQVGLLQRQAQQDAVSGLPLRAHFVGRLQQRLAEPGGPGLALLLLRMQQLDTLNARLGHEATDRLLGTMAELLLAYVRRVPGTFAGRLNGCDFALCLPATGVAQETAESLLAAIGAAPALREGGADVVIGAVDGLRAQVAAKGTPPFDASAALAVADAALAQAEAHAEAGGPRLSIAQHVQTPADAAGAQAWRSQIEQALAQGRARLAEFPLVDRDGRVLHLDCPLRVQIGSNGSHGETADGADSVDGVDIADGADSNGIFNGSLNSSNDGSSSHGSSDDPGDGYQPAGRWLAMARRSRLLPQVDLVAVDLALKAIAQDGRARAVHAAAASLSAPDFVAQVTHKLAQAPAAAGLLLVQCVEGLRPDDAAAMRVAMAAAAAAWQPFGVRIGIEHAGNAPQQLPALRATGIAYVKVDARHVRGAAEDAAVRGYAQSLVALIHGLGLLAWAEGLDDARDLAAVWALDFDGATGPAVTAALDAASA